MFTKMLISIAMISFSAVSYAYSQEDIDDANSKLSNATKRLEEAQVDLVEAKARLKAAERDVANREAVVSTTQDEVATLQKLLQLYIGTGSKVTQQDRQTVSDITSKIHFELQKAWRIPVSSKKDAEATLAIRLNRDGTIEGTSIVNGSGDAAFDMSALQAAKRVGKFHGIDEVDDILFERRLRNIRVVFRRPNFPGE